MPHSTPTGRAWAPQPFLPFGLKITSPQPPVPSASKPRPSSCSSGHQPYGATGPPRLPGTPPRPPPHPPAPVEDRARLPCGRSAEGTGHPASFPHHGPQRPATSMPPAGIHPRLPGSHATGHGLGPDFHNNQPQIFPSKGLERLPPPAREAPPGGTPLRTTPATPEEGASFLKAFEKPRSRWRW